nr:MAG TPA: hypothetical protein [Bacteriophage sp.]
MFQVKSLLVLFRRKRYNKADNKQKENFLL